MEARHVEHSVSLVALEKLYLSLVERSPASPLLFHTSQLADSPGHLISIQGLSQTRPETDRWSQSLQILVQDCALEFGHIRIYS